MILYIGLQEVLRQITLTCKDRGYLLLKLFKKYFEENEKKWQSILRELKEVIHTLKNDRDLLLSKYEDMPPETKSVLDNNELSHLNLIEHKHLIKRLIGALYSE